MIDVATFERARVDPTRVVLEGFHALKHAVRFGAVIESVVTPDPAGFDQLVRELAPDVGERLGHAPTRVSSRTWNRLVARDLPSPALAVARRPTIVPTSLIATERSVVLLEDPTHLGNLGAVVRVAAAAGAGAVLTTGAADPWHPTAVRAAAGLHFAVPVVRVGRSELGPWSGPRVLVAIDPGGAPLRTGGLPARPLLAFGSERRGLSRDLLVAADERVRIPMQADVSSLNLASAVAVVLYSDVLTASDHAEAEASPP